MKRVRNQFIYHVSNALRKAGIPIAHNMNPHVKEMRETIDGLEDKAIQFYIEQHPDGSWTAQSTNIDGIMSGSRDPREIPELLRDAVFTYFEVPPQHSNDILLRSDNEPVKVQQTVHVSA